MLTRLSIENIALIEKIEIDFDKGMNILTGETGAGKSIMLDAITALMGHKISKDLIRTGKDRAIVEGIFTIDDTFVKNSILELGVELDDDTVLVSREFSRVGRNVCKINGRMVTLSDLRKLGSLLIDIHGQNENLSLINKDIHISFLDSYVKEDFDELKINYQSKFFRRRELKVKLKDLLGDRFERERRIDLLKFEIEEIDNANLNQDEYDELINTKNLLVNSEKIGIVLNSVSEVLCESDVNVSNALNSVVSTLHSISSFDEKYRNLFNKIQNIYYEVEDITSDVNSLKNQINYEPELLDEVSDRLDLISRLKRKYGQDIKKILEYNEKLKLELNEIENSEEIVNNINKEIDILEKEMKELALKMSNLRKRYSKELELSIETTLNDLEMKNTKFIVDIKNLNDFDINGLDDVEFLISPNVGEDAKSLGKIASGGEMSRIMLAIKTILADLDFKDTLIFDEVDTGISGNAVVAVANKLAKIAHNHQVICVTHHAYIAAMADQHFYIEKVVEDGRTFAKYSLVYGDNQNKVLAKIIGGSNVTDVTLNHVRELKDMANRVKNGL